MGWTPLPMRLTRPPAPPSRTAGGAYVALQLVGLLGVLDVELLEVTGVVVKLLAVGQVAGLCLALLGLLELRLVGVHLEAGALLPGLPLVLQVALQLAGRQRVHHLGVVLHAAQPHLLALLLQVGLLVADLRGEGTRGEGLHGSFTLGVCFCKLFVQNFTRLYINFLSLLYINFTLLSKATCDDLYSHTKSLAILWLLHLDLYLLLAALEPFLNVIICVVLSLTWKAF